MKKTVSAVWVIFGIMLLILGVVVFGMSCKKTTSKQMCRSLYCTEYAEVGSRFCKKHGKEMREWRKRQEEISKISDSVNSKKPSDHSGSGETQAPSYRPTYNSHDAYDDGYADVYEDDDYDLDRYNSDPDYASGVDDAIEDAEW